MEFKKYLHLKGKTKLNIHLKPRNYENEISRKQSSKK